MFEDKILINTKEIKLRQGLLQSLIYYLGAFIPIYLYNFVSMFFYKEPFNARNVQAVVRKKNVQRQEYIYIYAIL